MREKTEFLRRDLMRVACKNNRGHIAPSLSCLEILVALKYKVMQREDVLIFSKAHGAYGLYAIEADQGRIMQDKWENFDLCGTYDGLGALGHGLPIAAGIAFGRKLQNKPGHIFVLVGDGELQEGSNWEALAFIKHHSLTNITIIVDHNRLQAIEPIQDVLRQDLGRQFYGWGFTAVDIDGHDLDLLCEYLSGHLRVIIAHTTKGNGYPAMEDVAKFHYRIPTEEERTPR